MEFKEFPKMARLSRDIIITEKIDGTNASIFIQSASLETDSQHVIADNGQFTIRPGSRNKWIIPGKNSDNAGFASWVATNNEELFKLGEGQHFGEWWGSGIQRGYGLKEKRFSLFNTYRWRDGGTDERPSCCHVVPILYEGPFDTTKVDEYLLFLKENGSFAAPGFMRPEGIVIWHTAANIGFKKTIEKDELPKSLVK